MRFFIGAIISTLIFSPISVLSTALDFTSTDTATKASNDLTKAEVAEFGGSSAQVKDDLTQVEAAEVQDLSSSGVLSKRFCLRNCKKPKHSSGYQCKKKYFSNEKIRRAQAAACHKIKQNKQRSPFPSIFTAFDYDVPGPYLEWPIRRNGRFWNSLSRSRYRIILTKKCKVVGAVVRNSDSSYVKCENLKGEEEEEDEE